MNKLEKYVFGLNENLIRQIKQQFGRAPLAGELIDLNTPRGQVYMMEHFEMLLEDESLLQDGMRSRKEAAADERKYLALVKELQTYTGKKSRG